MRVEIDDFIKAVKPRTWDTNLIEKGSCGFRVLINSDGEIFIEGGCNLLYNLQSGFNHFLVELIRSDNEWKTFKVLSQYEDIWERYYWDIDLHLLKKYFLEQKPCPGCGGLKIQKNQERNHD